MNEMELRRRFPKASDDFIRRNITTFAVSESPSAAPVEKKRLRQKAGDGMNSTERAFSLFVRSQHHGATILAQQITLLLANGVRYTPDFIVVAESSDPEPFPASFGFFAYEVKGFMRDDAAVKIKVAASLYPWITFRLVTKKRKKDGGGWAIEQVLP